MDLSFNIWKEGNKLRLEVICPSLGFPQMIVKWVRTFFEEIDCAGTSASNLEKPLCVCSFTQ